MYRQAVAAEDFGELARGLRVSAGVAEEYMTPARDFTRRGAHDGLVYALSGEDFRVQRTVPPRGGRRSVFTGFHPAVVFHPADALHGVRGAGTEAARYLVLAFHGHAELEGAVGRSQSRPCWN